MENYEIFISFNFDDEITDELVRLQRQLKDAGTRGNITKQENLHMTAAFIGEYGNPDDVLDILEQVAFRPIDISFDDVQIFREMYLLRIKSNHGLESYVRRLRRALAESEIPFDRKKFSPHITLIRKVSFQNGTIDATKKIIIPNSASVRKVSLMRSVQGKSGMIYTELGSIE